MAELLNLLFNLADAVKATNPVYDPRRPAQVIRTSPMGDAPDMSGWAYMDGGAASDPRTAGPMGTRINRPFPGYEIEWPNPRADANRLEGVGTGLPAGHNPDLLTAAVRKLFGTIPGIGPINRGYVSDESPVTAPGLPRTPPTTDVATRPQPMSILDSIGAVASNSPAGTATGSLPDGLKSLFAPLMETMVRDAQLRNDPISRMGDVGLAMLDASGGGKPFAQSLAPLDAARQQATGGAMNMFLQVMGLDKQLEMLKATERRHQEDMAFRKDEAAARRVSEERSFGLKERELASEDAVRKARITEMERGDKGALSKKVAELKSVYPGVDNETLIGVATGVIEIKANPVTGTYARVNKITGQVTEISPTGPARGTDASAPPAQPPAKGESLYDQAAKGTGVWSSVGRIWSDVAGQVSPELVPRFAESAVKARSALTVASQDLVRTLMINPRVTEGERRDIAKRIDVSPDMFTSPQTMRINMHEIDKFLESKEDEYSRRLADPNLSPKDRQDWRTTLSAIRDYRRRLGANPDPDQLRGGRYLRDEDGWEIWELPGGKMKRVKR